MPLTTLSDTIEQFGNGTSLQHAQVSLLVPLFLALLLLAVFGRARGPYSIDLDLRTRPAVRWEAAAGLGALVLGLAYAWVTDGAFDARYASMMFPLFVLVVAFGFTAFSSRVVLGLVLALVVVGGLVGGARNVAEQRTQAGQLADALLAHARPGDVVVYCPDQLGPAVNRLLDGGRGLHQMTYPSGKGPAFVDWVDYRDRIAATDPGKFARRVLARAGDHSIWFVANPAYLGFAAPCENLGAALGAARPQARPVVAPDPEGYFESGALTQFAPG